LDEAAQSPELIYALFVSAKTFARVLDTYGQIPTGTLAVVAANVAVFSLPNGVAFGDVCLNPYAVLHLNQLERLVTSAFVHADIYHLLSNMTGVLEDGSYLEARDGTAGFIGRLVTLLGLSQCTLVGMSW
jgi:membrane associated rhomboid family serine protease